MYDCMIVWYVHIKVQRGHSSDQPGLLNDYCDGSNFKSHTLFSVHLNGIQIFFYYDDVEVCNPIGSHRKIHKIGGLKIL